MEDVLNYLKRNLGNNLVGVIQFGSSVYGEKHNDTDLMIIIEKPAKLVITKKDFAINCIEKSPLFVGMLLSGFKVLHGENFVYKWLPALINRMKKSDVLYHKHRVI